MAGLALALFVLYLALAVSATVHVGLAGSAMGGSGMGDSGAGGTDLGRSALGSERELSGGGGITSSGGVVITSSGGAWATLVSSTTGWERIHRLKTV